jgi:hypothetical protein
MNFRRSIVVLGVFATAAWRPVAVDAQVNAGVIASNSDAVSRPAADKSGRWRYKYHDGRWWYWLPSNSWVFYHNQRWVPYSRQSYLQALQAGGASGRRDVAYRGLEESPQWPRGDNGSSPNASPEPGGAALGSRSPSALPPRGKWPRAQNGSSPYAAARPGGAAAEATGNDSDTVQPPGGANLEAERP